MKQHSLQKFAFLKRFFVVLAILVAGTNSVLAQSWTASAPANGTFYLYNVGSGRYLTSGTYWGSHAALNPHPVFPLTLANISEGVYTISTNAIYEGKYLGDNEYMDNGTAVNWTFTLVSDNMYTIHIGDSYLQWNGYANTYNVQLGSSTNNANSYWKLVTKDNLEVTLSNASSSSPVDATFYMTNSWFAKGNGLQSDNSGIVPKGWQGTIVTDYWGNDGSSEDTNYAIEQYGKVFDNYQMLTVPNGEYKLSAQGFYRTGEYNKGVPVFYANSASKNFVHIDSDGPTEKPNNIGTAAAALRFEGNLYYSVSDITAQVTNGTLRVGTKCIEELVDWCAFDNFSLQCTGLYFSANAIALPNDNTTPLTANQWYYYEAPSDGIYNLNGNRVGMVCTMNGAQFPDDIAAYSAPNRQSLTAGSRIYFKTSKSGETLSLTMDQSDEVTFTACALNVDGLPQQINLLVYQIDMNGDGPGGDGTKQISSYLAGRNLDILGFSEDFNYDGSLHYYLDSYNRGTYRGAVALSGGATLNGLRFDTDGLNLYTSPGHRLSNESWTEWNTQAGSITEGNGGQYDEIVTKGFRHYNVEIKSGFIVDVYVLHMDAGSREGSEGVWNGKDTEARNAQWTQLAGYILNNNDNDLPKIIIGDTNSRYTREQVYSNFIEVINATNKYEAKDAWVELVRGRVYPKYKRRDLTDGTPNEMTCEIVDKIIYINPLEGKRIKALAFDVDKEGYKYPMDYSDANKRGEPLGDHAPVVVTFRTENASNVGAEQSQWWVGEIPTHSYGEVANGYYIYNVGYQFFISENGSPVITDIHKAPRWPANGDCSSTSDNTSFSRSSSWCILKNSTGVGSGSAREFRLKQGEPNQTPNSYKLWYGDNHRFGIAYSNGSYSYNDATKTSDIYNDWFFITQAQKDAYDAYVAAYNNLNTLSGFALPTDLYTELQQLLSAADPANANYTTCGKIGDNKLTDQMMSFYNRVISRYESFINYPSTDKITNPSFENFDNDTREPTGWTITDGSWDTGSRRLDDATYTFTGSNLGDYTFNTWDNKVRSNGYYCYQDIADMPAGYYILSAYIATDTQYAEWNGAEGVENIRNHQIVKLILGENNYDIWIEKEKGEGVLYKTLVYHTGGPLRIGAKSETWFKADNFQLTRYEDYYDVTVTAAKWATVSLPVNTTIPSGVQIYYATATNTKNEENLLYTLHVEEYTNDNNTLPSGTNLNANNKPSGFFVHSETPQVYRFYVTTNTASVPSGNILNGTPEAEIKAADRSSNVYVLANKEPGVGMYKLADGQDIKRFYGYVEYDGSTSASTGFIIDTDGSTNGIGHSTAGEATAVAGIYSVNGMRQNNLRRGMNIVRMGDGNVKKVLVK